MRQPWFLVSGKAGEDGEMALTAWPAGPVILSILGPT